MTALFGFFKLHLEADGQQSPQVTASTQARRTPFLTKLKRSPHLAAPKKTIILSFIHLWFSGMRQSFMIIDVFFFMIHIFPFHIHSFMILGDEDDAVRYGWVGKNSSVLQDTVSATRLLDEAVKTEELEDILLGAKGTRDLGRSWLSTTHFEGQRNCGPSPQPTIISKCLLDLCINPVRHIGYVGRSLSGGSLGEWLDQTHRCRFRQDSWRNGLKSRVWSKHATVATLKVCEGILGC